MFVENINSIYHHSDHTVLSLVNSSFDRWETASIRFVFKYVIKCAKVIKINYLRYSFRSQIE